MRLFINISNLVMGGAIQVAHSFISELNNIKTDDSYLICYSPYSIGGLKPESFPDKFKFVSVSVSPAKPINRKKITKELYKIECDFSPDIVFTIFGPSYWIPKAQHICGFADGWIYNPKSIVYKRLPLFSRIKKRLLNVYKIHRLKKESSHYILETHTAKNQFVNVLGISESKVSVVSNTFNSVFTKKDKLMNNIPSEFKDKSFKLLTVSSYYANKNLEVINKVIDFIPSNISIKFYVTLPANIYKKLFIKNSKYITNLGPISIDDCPKYYALSDAIFLPSLLETFSASYPEAMIMGKPILTSNYTFAKEICGEAAEYFDPLDPKDIAKKIIRLATDYSRRYELIERGKIQVRIFPSAQERAQQYLHICEKFVKK